MKIRLTYAKNQYNNSESEIYKRITNWNNIKEQYENIRIETGLVFNQIYFDIDEEYLLPFISYFGSPYRIINI